MVSNKKFRLDFAKAMLEKFVRNTGINKGTDHSENRYLWTDALAVESFLSLNQLSINDKYLQKALILIDLVHYHLGKFHPLDLRSGWISGLPEKRALQHPTAAGLRIGKRLPESHDNKPIKPVDEWERDGQYFHYNMKWIEALLQTYRLTRELKFARWAAELLEASSRFLNFHRSEVSIYWKMNTDLTRPQLKTQGLLDPLDGLVTTLQIIEIFPDKRGELNYLLNEFRSLCKDCNWETEDPLTAAGLLQIALKATMLEDREKLKPVTCSQLFKQAFNNIDKINRQFETGPAQTRLAFRECGLSMSINRLSGCSENSEIIKIPRSHLLSFIQLAHEIEEFWVEEANQQADSWLEHENINLVSLAASLIMNQTPVPNNEIFDNKKPKSGNTNFG